MPDNDGRNGNGRDNAGRFIKGNPGGPGNPNLRMISEARRKMLGAVTEEQMLALVEATMRDAIAGDPVSRKIAWEYLCGKPRSIEHDDDADDDLEWTIIRDDEGLVHARKRSGPDTN
jgi:hypothetical protein